jgi:hypothetical protein
LIKRWIKLLLKKSDLRKTFSTIEAHHSNLCSAIVMGCLFQPSRLASPSSQLPDLVEQRKGQLMNIKHDQTVLQDDQHNIGSNMQCLRVLGPPAVLPQVPFQHPLLDQEAEAEA